MKKILFVLSVTVVFFSSCTKEPTATKILMQGNWQLTAATDANGNDILSKVTFPVTVIQLTDDNGMLGTHAPLATRVVYGDTKWTEASGKMNQLFDYANLRLNTGEFFVGEGSVNNFTIEFKLQATAIAGGVLSDILSIFGVANGWLQQTVYHKFTNVRISFPGEEPTIFTSKANEDRNTMIWEFTDQTQGFYNYKDSQGNSVLWNGWPVDKFARGKYTWTKKTEGINDIVKANL
jgi:hypothetical protein